MFVFVKSRELIVEPGLNLKKSRSTILVFEVTSQAANMSTSIGRMENRVRKVKNRIGIVACLSRFGKRPTEFGQFVFSCLPNWREIASFASALRQKQMRRLMAIRFTIYFLV
ncbi:hypothetical protein AVEN_119267-1 [Araneus ventricosus]|uniref:Uncharacterized protein n=1 Tax=Araneus ventricosus TaxID=182803 RepID=A0A4Y2NZ57_ARAVE|nr:hypothetical protein AVEN_119267-1 [Araneus ventricosus]